MITELTSEQNDLISVYREKWLKIGLSTNSCDKTKAEDAIKRAYESVKLNPPKEIIWFDDLIEAARFSLKLGWGSNKTIKVRDTAEWRNITIYTLPNRKKA